MDVNGDSEAPEWVAPQDGLKARLAITSPNELNATIFGASRLHVIQARSGC